jgi:uncharacterized membrane protein
MASEKGGDAMVRNLMQLKTGDAVAEWIKKINHMCNAIESRGQIEIRRRITALKEVAIDLEALLLVGAGSSSLISSAAESLVRRKVSEIQAQTVDIFSTIKSGNIGMSLQSILIDPKISSPLG